MLLGDGLAHGGLLSAGVRLGRFARPLIEWRRLCPEAVTRRRKRANSALTARSRCLVRASWTGVGSDSYPRPLPAEMDFHILGRLEVLDEARETVAVAGSKQRALLALLLLHGNETLSTGRLIDELWGEAPPATAAKTVYVHVSRLRKALAA